MTEGWKHDRIAGNGGSDPDVGVVPEAGHFVTSERRDYAVREIGSFFGETASK